jgi:glutathione S-transferase
MLMMKLYGILGSNNVRRAYAVALHLGLGVEVIETMPRSPAVNTPEFRRMSPAGRVPAFEDGDFRTDESHAIMLYLAEAKPNTLWPADRKSRSEVMRWLSWSLAHWRNGWGPLQLERVIKPLMMKAEPDLAEVARALPIFHAEAEILDAHLANRQYLVGDGLTLADFSVVAGFCYAEPAQLPLESYANIRSWRGRIEALPAWQKSAPPRRA